MPSKELVKAVFFRTKSDPGTRLLTQPMQVLEKAVYRGPHYFSLTPMVRIMHRRGRPANRAGRRGAVYVVDGAHISHCNVADATADDTLSMHHVTVHVLAAGDSFELGSRRPHPPTER